MSDVMPRNVMTRQMFAQKLHENFDKLPVIDQQIYSYGRVYFGVNSAFVGLISNSLYRHVLNINRGLMISVLPMSVLPLVVSVVTYSTMVTLPLIQGNLNCSSCVAVRGALVGALVGVGYPVILALPLNLGLAARIDSTPMPEPGHKLRFAWQISQPVLRKLRAAILLQALFGTYLGSRDFQTYTRLMEITFGQQGEELGD